MKKLMPFVMLAMLGACGGSRSGAEEAVLASLKDPDSAKFGEFYYNSDTKKGCLAVNAKNSMGGYTGEQPALVQETEDGWVTSIADMAFETCRSLYADVAD